MHMKVGPCVYVNAYMFEGVRSLRCWKIKLSVCKQAGIKDYIISAANRNANTLKHILEQIFMHTEETA